MASTDQEYLKALNNTSPEKKRWLHGLKEKAIELRCQQRLSTAEISQRIPISQITITRWLKKFPLSKIEKEEKDLARRINIDNSIHSLWEAGQSMKQISNITGYTLKTVYSALDSIEIQLDRLLSVDMAVLSPKEQAIRIRLSDKLSTPIIGEMLGIDGATVRLWTSPYPLSDWEMSEIHRKAGKMSGAITRQRSQAELNLPCRYQEEISTNTYSSTQTGNIAEAAIRRKCQRLHFEFYAPAYGCAFFDGIIYVPQARQAWKVQIKTATHHNKGLPTVSTRSSKNKYLRETCDFLIGYEIVSDTAYVWSHDELIPFQYRVSLRPDAKENWKKLICT